MTIRLNRVILYVQDVERLAAFYRDVFSVPLVEHIPDEWAVLKAGACEIALHRVGEPYRVSDASAWRAESNAKLVFSFDGDLAQLRSALIARGVAMDEIKSYPGTGRLSDGRDPEGNVFQIAEVKASSGRVA